MLGLALALYVQPMREIFRFAPPSGYQLLMSVAAAALGLTWLELYKGLRRHAWMQTGQRFSAQGLELKTAGGDDLAPARLLP